MITDRDIVVRAIAKGKDPRGMPAREVSSRELVTVGPDNDLFGRASADGTASGATPAGRGR
jgi:CBS domain-containing protein